MKDDKSLIWFTLEEIKYFIEKDALVNMDLRSVISMIPTHGTKRRMYRRVNFKNQ